MERTMRIFASLRPSALTSWSSINRSTRVGPAGRLLFHVLGSIAEFERDLIRERVSAGVAAAKRRGQRFGRPRALSPNAVARLARLVASGQSGSAIARLLGTSLSRPCSERSPA